MNSTGSGRNSGFPPTLPNQWKIYRWEKNRDYLVDYDEREKAKKPFTSQVAESHIDSIINTRHKRKQKMQWTREGAHNVLQIRALMASYEWEKKWLEYVIPNLDKVA